LAVVTWFLNFDSSLFDDWIVAGDLTCTDPLMTEISLVEI
jgi:hypothetical protein